MLYTTLLHNLIKEKLNDLIEWTFHGEDSLYLACNVRNAFFTSEVHKNYTLWTCQKVYEALTFLLDNIYIRFGLFVLRFYGPVNPMGSCRARSVYQTTRLLGRLSPLSG